MTYYTGLLLCPPLFYCTCIDFIFQFGWTIIGWLSSSLSSYYNPLLQHLPQQSMYCYKKRWCNIKLKSLCTSCTSLKTDQESKVENNAMIWEDFWMKERSEGPSSVALPRLPLKGLLMIVFMLWFEYCVSNGKKGKWFVLYTQDIWREKWRTSLLMGLRSMPNCQSAASTW